MSSVCVCFGKQENFLTGISPKPGHKLDRESCDPPESANHASNVQSSADREDPGVRRDSSLYVGQDPTGGSACRVETPSPSRRRVTDQEPCSRTQQGCSQERSSLGLHEGQQHPALGTRDHQSTLGSGAPPHSRDHQSSGIRCHALREACQPDLLGGGQPGLELCTMDADHLPGGRRPEGHQRLAPEAVHPVVHSWSEGHPEAGRILQEGRTARMSSLKAMLQRPMR